MKILNLLVLAGIVIGAMSMNISVRRNAELLERISAEESTAKAVRSTGTVPGVSDVQDPVRGDDPFWIRGATEGEVALGMTCAADLPGPPHQHVSWKPRADGKCYQADLAKAVRKVW